MTTTTVDKPFLGKFTHLTHAQVIFIMLSVELVWIAYLTGDLQYNRSISLANQQNLATQNSENHNQTLELKKVLEAQGNLSASARSDLLAQFSYAANHGGFSTKDTQLQNLAQVQAMNLKLDKLLNATR
jgi:hypothetical protein